MGSRYRLHYNSIVKIRSYTTTISLVLLLVPLYMILLSVCLLILVLTSNAVDSEEVVPADGKSSVDGWHIIQVSGGKNAPTRFDLTLFWVKNSTRQSHKMQGQEEEQRPLLKLRTDLDKLTPKTERILKKFPPWCSFFGKSTSPHTLSFLSSLPVNF